MKKLFNQNDQDLSERRKVLLRNWVDEDAISKDTETVYGDSIIGDERLSKVQEAITNGMREVILGLNNPTVNQVSPTTSFIKHDKDKPRVSLVEPDFILGIADVLTMGAKKYSADNWKNATPEDISRIKDSLLRHILATEILDPESGLPHAHHAACNLMFLEYHRNNS